MTLYRTNSGKKFHASAYCHYLHRSSALRRTDHAITPEQAAEAGLDACSHCAGGVALPKTAPAGEAPAPVYCTGSGKPQKYPMRIQNTCPDCGKTLKSKIGGFRKHKP
jgi:hypothetical protein